MGCVPKKLMFHSASHAEELGDLDDYGFKGIFNKGQKFQFQWKEFKEKRDNYIKRLNGIYGANLDKSKVLSIISTRLTKVLFKLMKMEPIFNMVLVGI